MLVCIPNVLDAAQLVSVRERLDRANEAWVDGRVTAGYQGAPVKFNQQIDERSDVALACQRIVVLGARAQPDLHQRRPAQRRSIRRCSTATAKA